MKFSFVLILFYLIHYCAYLTTDIKFKKKTSISTLCVFQVFTVVFFLIVTVELFAPVFIKPYTYVDDRSLANELSALLRVMWSGKWAVVSPHQMLSAVWAKMPFFKGYTQHDAQEFLRSVNGSKLLSTNSVCSVLGACLNYVL